jgi:hypothetical protein
MVEADATVRVGKERIRYTLLRCGYRKRLKPVAHQAPFTTLTPFGMPLALLRSELTSISVPQPRAYHKAQASAVRLANGHRRSVQN